jgi:hypothetical protein
MSYQTSNDDLTATYETAAIHFNKGRLFLFDFRYGPAVLIQKPEVQIRRLEDEEIKIIRIAEPVMHVNENVVDVNYTVFIKVKLTGQVEQVKEKNLMRYLFLQELKCYGTGKFKEIFSNAWMTNDALNVDTWGEFQSLVRE